MTVNRGARSAVLAVVAVLALLAAGCSGRSAGSGHDADARALAAYLAAVEPIRTGVNHLLDGADPILDGYRDRTLPGTEAASQMAMLEQAFARYTAEVGAVTSLSAVLAQLHAPYARTYLQEDAYLQALVSGLRSGDLSNLPHTEDDQRAAIVRWRDDLTAFAARTGVTLPDDVAHAGQGEIAPSPDGS
jgi:hypothetical protein